MSFFSLLVLPRRFFRILRGGTSLVSLGSNRFVATLKSCVEEWQENRIMKKLPQSVRYHEIESLHAWSRS